jgi:outer membrane protein TolC
MTKTSIKKGLRAIIWILVAWPVWLAAQEAPPLVEAPRVLDLEAACRLALAANPSLEAAAARVEAAAQRVRQAQSSYFPRLDAAAGLTRMDMAENDYQTTLAQTRFFNPAATLPNPEDVYQAELTARWTVFDGFQRRFALLAARHGARAAAESRDESRRLLLAAVAASFHGAQLAREAVAIAEADAHYNERLMEEAEIRRQVGTGALSEVLNFQVAANAARADVIGARRELATARSALAALLGLETGRLPDNWVAAELKPETGADGIVPEAADQIAYALTHRPDLQRGAEEIRRADADLGAARSGFWPTVSVFATVDGDRTNDARWTADDLGDAVGITLSHNLFAGGQTRARVAEARMNRTALQKDLEDDRLQASAQVVQALSDLAAAGQQLALQRENARLVQRNRDLVEKEYAVGQASLVRLNEAQRNLVSAQGRLAQARVALAQARFALDTATARILAHFGEIKEKSAVEKISGKQ